MNAEKIGKHILGCGAVILNIGVLGNPHREGSIAIQSKIGVHLI